VIYFMQSVDGGPIKIGFTDDIERRREQLEAIYGTPLAVLATMDGGRDEETEVHRRFSHLRFGRTEQFRPTSELMEFIGRPLLIGANPDAVEAMPFAAGQPTLFAVKGKPSWHAWLKEYADSLGMDATVAIDNALRQQAKRDEFPKPMPKRMGK